MLYCTPGTKLGSNSGGVILSLKGVQQSVVIQEGGDNIRVSIIGGAKCSLRGQCPLICPLILGGHETLQYVDDSTRYRYISE